mmetsp:Transcript_47170/g.124395  ORF Transcript_47170/g.124395 Transcript_47170/m.124395 type:complete len:325 (+) Transcript_47170:840-1814(+)
MRSEGWAVMFASPVERRCAGTARLMVPGESGPRQRDGQDGARGSLEGEVRTDNHRPAGRRRLAARRDEGGARVVGCQRGVPLGAHLEHQLEGVCGAGDRRGRQRVPPRGGRAGEQGAAGELRAHRGGPANLHRRGHRVVPHEAVRGVQRAREQRDAHRFVCRLEAVERRAREAHDDRRVVDAVHALEAALHRGPNDGVPRRAARREGEDVLEQLARRVGLHERRGERVGHVVAEVGREAVAFEQNLQQELVGGAHVRVRRQRQRGGGRQLAEDEGGGDYARLGEDDDRLGGARRDGLAREHQSARQLEVDRLGLADGVARELCE